MKPETYRKICEVAVREYNQYVERFPKKNLRSFSNEENVWISKGGAKKSTYSLESCLALYHSTKKVGYLGNAVHSIINLSMPNIIRDFSDELDSTVPVYYDCDAFMWWQKFESTEDAILKIQEFAEETDETRVKNNWTPRNTAENGIENAWRGICGFLEFAK